MADPTAFRVPLVDVKRRAAEEKEELCACFERALSDGQFILGPAVASFEAAAARLIGAAHVIGLNSGTDALMMALWACGVGRDDEVITTPVSFVATTGAIVHLGARPVYVDVGPDQNLDPAGIEAALTPRTRAIVPVHWCGRVADMDAIQEVARAHRLAVIEDAAQAMGATYRGRHPGSFGVPAAFSSHPLKILAALGDAGFLSTDDAELAGRVRLYRSHGLETRDCCVLYGVNSRLDALHAAILELRLGRLAEVIERRRRHVALYRQLLRPGPLRLPEERPHERVAWTIFNLEVERRDQLRAYLAERGVETLLYYGTPLHLHPAATRLGYRRGDFPVAEEQCDRVLALPHHQHLSEDQIAFVAETVNAFYG
jgi:dTDP-4-amino-4,6-dideoxygalactose transaminase